MAWPILTKGSLPRHSPPWGRREALGLLLIFSVKEHFLDWVGGGLRVGQGGGGLSQARGAGLSTHSFSKPVQM